MLLATVTGVNPLQGSSTAPASTDITADYDQVINPASATTDNFVVHSSQGSGTLGAADATVTASGMTITLDPNSNFFAGEPVQVTSTAGVQGTSAGTPFVWHFRTGVSGGLGTFTDTGQVIADPDALALRANTQGVAVGDLDGDGDIDAFTANGNDTTARLYLNDGSAVFTDSGQDIGAVGGGNDVALADLDADGDLDAVVARNGANDVFLNDGSGVFSAGTAFGNSNTSTIRLADLDGDGDIDAMGANTGTQGNVVWLNNGSGTFTQGNSLGNHNTISLGLGDFDNDGDIDAFSGTVIGQFNRVWVNDGSGNFTDSGQTVGVTATKSSREVVIGDVDGDGDVDVFVSNQDYVNRLYLNDGGGIFTDSGQILDNNPAQGGNPLRTRGGVMGDFDSDGDLDIVTANQSRQTNRLWTNDGNGVFTATNLNTGNFANYSPDVAAGDFDGDGDLDLFWTGTDDLSDAASASRVFTNNNPVINVSIAADPAAVAEADGVSTITATLSAASAQDVTIDLAVSGTATDTDDYTISGTQIIVPSGSTTGTVTITAVQDTLDEADETVIVDIASVTGATGAGQATVTITDDDDAPTVALAIDNAAIAENGGTATVTATLSAVSGQDVTVDLGASGTADGADYTLSATQITIAAGSTSGTVDITAIDDVIDEPDETVVLDITAATGATEDGTQQVTTTITDDDLPPTVTLAVDEANIPEDGGVATFTVTMSAPSLTDTTVDLAVSGTATVTTDFTISATQVVIAAGSTSGSVTVTSVADVQITEGGETVVVDIAAIAGNATEDGTQQATTTIVDDVNGPDVTLTVDNTTLAEAGGVATLTLTLANAFSLPVTIDLGLAGTATGGGTDYTASATQIVIPVGETTGTATITAVDDALIEGDETIDVDVANVVNGNEVDTQQANLTITDDETPPTVTLAVDMAAIAEDAGVATVTATASAVSTLDITVGLAITGTATPTDDYTTSASEIVIPAGSTTGTLLITAVQDTLDDDDETIVVDVDSVTNATEDGTQQATVTITDDDDAPPLPPGPTPVANAIDAPVNTVVGFTFAQAVTPETATDATFVVHGTQTGRLVGDATTVTTNGPTVQQDPTNDFHAGEYVQVSVTSNITTAGGAAPKQVFEFRTAAGGTGNLTESGQQIGDITVQTKSWDVVVGDLDGDGDLDMFVTNWGGTYYPAAQRANRVYLNDGTGVFTDSGQSLGDHNSRHPAMGDLDGDGDLDVIVPNDGNQGDRVYLNDGTGVFTESQVIAGNNSEDAEIADLDGDGDLDAFIGVSNGADRIWLNDGTGNMVDSGGTIGNHSTDAVELGDLDGDGDIDAFTIGFYDEHRVWLNNGNGQFTDNGQDGFSPSEGFGRGRRSDALALGDLDGDGDIDAHVANSDYENEIWLNQGDGTFVDSGQRLQPTYTTYGRRNEDTEIGDLDGDGDLDLFTVAHNLQAHRIWANDGDGVFTDFSMQTLDINTQSTGVALADVNGDGALDAVIANDANLNGPQDSVSRVWFNEVLTPTVTLGIDPDTIAESGGVTTITASLSAAFGSDTTVDFSFGGTADASDYTASGTQIVIAAGSTSGTITITANDDALDEADETIVADVTNITNGSGGGQLTATITDDDPTPTVTLAVDSATIAEAGGVATFTATLSAASGQDVTLDLGITGTAAASDYTASATQIVIPAGSTSGTVTVTAVDDGVDEPDDTVIVDITAAVGATEDGEQQATTTILDDDDPPTVALSVDNASIDEDGGVATVTATLSAESLLDVTIDLAVSGTATGGTDYNISGTSITIPAGSTTGTVTVTSIADIVITEGGETVVVDVDAVTNATEDGTQQVTTTIIDDVGGPDVTLSIDMAAIAEGGGSATVTATLANAFALDVTVELGFSGTAAGTDYTASATQIVVPAGSTTGTVTITANDDAIIESNETVVVDVAAVINGNEATEQQVTTTIVDDEAKPTVTLAVDSESIAEGGVATLTATSSSASEEDVTVALAFSGTATQPDGYTVSATEIVIAAGSTTGTVTITATEEGADDGDQTVIVDIDTVTNGFEDGTQQTTTTIIDDDEAPPIPPGPEPARNAFNVPNNNQIAFNFEQNVTAATQQSFVVHGTHSVGQLVGPLSDFTVTGPVVSHMPTGSFAPGEIVNVTATAGITTSTGAVTPTVWQFRAATTSGSGQFELSPQVPPGGGTGFVVVGDADGDGDLDAIEGTNLLLNDGAGNFTDSGQNVGSGQEKDFADIDGDGDLDVVSNTIWQNDGAGVFTNIGAGGGGLAIDVGDVDGDGDLDIAAGTGGYGGARVLLNNGSGAFTDTGQVLNGGFDQPRAIEFGDLDNDGDLDMYVGTWTTSNRAWMNDGNGVFTLGFSGPAGSTQDIDLGDFDGDGDLDVLHGNAGGTGTGDLTSRVFFNDGTGQFTQGPAAIDPGRTTWATEIGDMDADGDLDLVIFNRTGNAGNTIWLNDGAGNFSQGTTFTFTGEHREYGGDIGDLNGDGALDVWQATNTLQGGHIWFNMLTEPSVTLSVDPATVAEADGVTTVTATLSAAHTQAVTVDLAFSGTADASDYTASATQISIAAGATSGTITITAVQDTVDEPDETVIVDISAVTNGNEAGAQQVTATILDDDEPVVPNVTIAVDSASIPEEAGVANFTLTLSEATTVDVTVDVALSGTAAATDYTVSATQVVIPAGSTSGTVTVTAVQDTEDEQNETVIVDIAAVVGGNEDGDQQATTTITDDDGPASFTVTTFDATSTGFTAQFNANLDANDLNLYDTSAGLGLADVTVVGATSGPVSGSLTVDPGLQMIYFIATGGALGADTYTVTLRSATDGFEDDTARLLDGNGDGTAGDDYSTSFTVADALPNTVTLSLPDFVRGPGQPVDIPANETGLPLTISEGAGVRNVTASIDYDPALLSITGATVGANMPAGATVNVDTSTAGTAVITFTSPLDLPVGSNTLVNLTATVPTENADANYRSKQVLDIHSVSVTDAGANNFPVLDDDALHVVQFAGDVSGNARINAADASQVAQFAALLIDGFSNAQNADPVIMADVSGNGRVNAADASQVAQFAALLPVDNIPAVPAGVVTSVTFLGPDPKLSIGSVEGAAGSSITVPVEIDSIVNLQQPNRLAGIGLVVEYDPAVLTATGVSNGTFITSNPGWSVVPNTGVAGRIVVVAFTSSPVGGQFIDNLVNLEFDIAANAPSGATALNLVPAAAGAFTELLDENDGVLVLEPAPTAATDDEVDGAVTVTGGAPTVSLAVDNADIAENGGVATVTATLSEAATADVTVDLAYSGTATDGADYTASATQITIATGATSGTATITAVDDAEDDNDETVIVDIVNVAGGANEAGEQQVTTTITDDDEPARQAGNRISIPMDIVAGAGEAVTVPINIELLNLSQAAGNRLAGVGVAATYDPAVLTLNSVDNGSFITGNPGWSLVPNTGTAGTVVLVGFTSSPVAGTLEDVLANLNFTVAANAAPGSETVINVVAQAGPAFTELLDENDGVLAFVDPITNDPTDAGDGRVTIGAAGPTVSLSIDPADIAENGGVATVTATLSEALTADVTVDLGISGTATDGDDYTASATQITIAAGSTTGAVTINAVDDDIDDDDETVVVDITNVVGASENGDQQVTATIIDDDEPVVLPTVSIAVDNAEIAENGGTATVTATLSAAATSDVVIDLAYSGTATNGDDYTASATQITIATGATSGTVDIVAVDDATDEPNETVIVDVTVSGGANEDGDQQVTTTILDDDVPAREPGNRISIPMDIVAGAGEAVTVPINIELLNLSQAAGNRLAGVGVAATYDPAVLTLNSVDNGSFITGNPGWSLVPNTGTAGTVVLVGFTSSPVAGTLEDVLANLNFTVAANAAPGSETVINVVAQAGPAFTELLDENDGVLAFVDPITNDPTDAGDGRVTIGAAGPTVSLSIDPADIAENGGVATVTATLSEALTADVTVDLGISGTATDGDDYTASATQITIAAGSTTGAVTINAVDDDIDDDDETVVVDITNVVGATENGDQQVTATIIDDDEPVVLPTVSIAVDNAEIAENGGTATVTATLSAAATSDVVIDLAYSGTATNGDDYTASATQITIATGATSGTVDIVAVDDATDEPNETVIVDVTVSGGANEDGDQQVTTTILDDDVPAREPGNRISIPMDIVAGAGEEVVVPINIELLNLSQAAGNRLAGVGVAATYDPAVLTLNSVDNGTFITGNPGWSLVPNTGTAGTVVLVGFTSSPVAGTLEDVLANLNFTVAANAAPGSETVINVVAQAGGAFTELLDENDGVLAFIDPITNDPTDAGDGIVTIAGDAGPTVALSIDNTSLAEDGGTATVTATLSAAVTADVVVDLGLSGTATNPDDYTASATQITIAAGATSGTATITAINDDVDEEDETVVIDITGVTGATEAGDQQVTATIVDDDDPVVPTVTLTVDNADIAEAGGVATFTATLSAAATADVTVDLGFTGTATDGTDYTASATQITIATGSTSGTVTVTAVDDDADEENETVIVDIVAANGATEDGDQQATTTITDDDEPALPTVTLTVDNADIAEAGGVATFTATLSAAATADVTVDLGFTGTATDGTDYTASATQITIATGSTSGTVTVTAVDDDADEENETVIVDIVAATGAEEDGDQQATTTITDDDEPVVPTVTLAVDLDSIPENGGVATFTATLSAAATADVVVDLGVTGTAANGADYTLSGTQITIATGATTGTVTVTAIDDADDEPDETVALDITNVTGATGSGAAVTTITDDDEPGPSVSLAIDAESIVEAEGVATVTATLSQALTADVTVDLAYSGTATNGTDYTASATQITIAAGATTGTATITAVQDTEVEPGETVIVDIAAVAGADEDGEQQVTTTIVDDDSGVNEPPVLTNPGDQSFPETQDTLDVTLEAVDPNLQPLTYSVTIEAAELFLDQTLDLGLSGELFTNFSGFLNEKWVLGGDGRTWYYIEPSGDFYRWLGGNVLNREFVAGLSSATYDNPALLYDAQPGATVPVTTTVTGNVVTLDPADGFNGSFTVIATVSDGELSDTESFLVNVEPNQAPTLIDPGSQTLPTTQDTLDVTLQATDPMDDPITFTAELQSAEYYLDQTIGFQLGPNGLEPNWSGSADERWVVSNDSSTWYFITPDGSLYRWLGGGRNILDNAELVATLSPATHADPALLYDAQAGVGTPNATVSVNGNILTIDPAAGFVGTFGVLITATDIGGLTDTALINVDVTAAPAAAIQIPLNLNLDLSAGGAEKAADQAIAAGELGFVEDSLGMAEELGQLAGGNAGTENSDAALDELFNDDLLGNDLTQSLALDLIKKDQ